ncbi:hypothetical protein B0H21DRAFT_727886 [Amylocystis lapponica]|nr:hypothetical protein B0H21DRAFT_727886 [Amylocystis lapponica]
MAQTSTDGKVTFQALSLANEQRNAYGLRYNDFERYRKHCANRTHRLRSSLKMTHGKGKEFKKLPPLKLDAVRDGHLQLLLFEAERAWVHSQELNIQTMQASIIAARHDPNSDAGRKRASLRRHATSRLPPLALSSPLCCLPPLPEDVVQATIYTLILNGRLFRERHEFDDAIVQLSVARNLLDELVAKAATSREQALAIAFADEIGPEIRHCGHELRREKAYDIDAIVAEVSGEHRNEIVEGCDALVASLGKSGEDAALERKKLEPLMWEDEPVPVRNPELVDVLLKVQDAERRLEEAGKPEQKSAQPVPTEGGKKRGKIGKGTRSKRGVAAYDAILLALSDAEDVARRLVEIQQLNASTLSAVTAGTRDIQFVYAYIVYQLLSRRIQRDLLLISTLLHQSDAARHANAGQKSTAGPSKQPKPQVDARLFPAVVKLLDTIIQSLDQMRILTIVDESPDLASAVEERISFTKARRCFYLARCYAPLKKYAEALALMQHAELHLREARSTLSILADTDPITAGPSPFYPLSEPDVARLESEVVSDSLSFKTAWFTYNGGTLDGAPKTFKKPLFFDIALNYVQLDMDRLQARAGKAKPPPRPPAPSAQAVLKPQVTEKKTMLRAKVDEIERVPTPEAPEPARGGLSTLLGGWWGRK